MAQRVRSRRLSPRWRKVVLVTHVAFSVGWLGASYAMTVLSVVAMRASDPALRHSTYQLMHINEPAIMYPFAIGVVGTGLTISLGTQWGLLRHYWVATKFVLTLVIMLFAALYVSQKVDLAVTLTASNSGGSIGDTGWEVFLGSAGMISVLVINTVLSVFKPWGRTRRGTESLRRAAGSSQIHTHDQVDRTGSSRAVRS